MLRPRTSDHLLIHHQPELNFLPHMLFGLVVDWLERHPSIAVTNSKPVYVLEKATEEVLETRDEQERESTEKFSSADLEKEAVDIMVLFSSVLLHENMVEELHLPSLASRVNGVGSRSDIFDQMQMMLQDMQERPLHRRDIEMFLAYWMSYWKHAPTQRQPDEVMREVIQKNDNNNPEIYFSGNDPRTGKELSLDEKHLQYAHARLCLRLIRDRYKRPEGLRTSDHLPFKDLILCFWDSESALNELREQLKRVNDFEILIDGEISGFRVEARFQSNLLIARQNM